VAQERGVTKTGLPAGQFSEARRDIHRDSPATAWLWAAAGRRQSTACARRSFCGLSFGRWVRLPPPPPNEEAGTSKIILRCLFF